MIRKYKHFIIMLMAAFVAISMVTVDAKASVKKSGKVDNEIAWTYNSKTKTLIFRPFKKSENPKKIKKHTSDLEYWHEKAKKEVFKNGVKRVLPYDVMINAKHYSDDIEYEFLGGPKKIVLSKSVKVIPTEAFGCCYRVNEVSMPAVEYIGKDSFNGRAFKVNKNKQIIFPKRIRRIEEGAFRLWGKRYRNASLKLNAGLEYIGERAFAECDLEEIIVSDSVTTIESEAFENSDNLKRIVLPKGLERIEEGLFRECKKLHNVTLPESVVRIDSYAFAYSGLKSIIIPSNVQMLGDSVFYKCKNLKKIEFSGAKIKKVYPNIMSGIPKNVEIVVPIGMKEKYREMFEGAGLSTDIVIVEKDFGEEKPFYKLSKNDITVKNGFTRRLNVLYLTGGEHITIKSEDESIASVSDVNSSGEAVIKALSVGDTVIKASVGDYELSCKVKVNPADTNNDEEELRKLIKKQREYGATVSTDIHDSSQYMWEDGRLVGIDWNRKSVYGNIDLNPFTYLSRFECSGCCWIPYYSYGNYVWSIDANDCSNLKYVNCENGYIREFYAENAVDLREVNLECSPVRIIDLSSSSELYELDLSRETMLKVLRINSNVSNKNVNKSYLESIAESVEYIVEPR